MKLTMVLAETMALLMAVLINKIYKKYFFCPKNFRNNIENSQILLAILGDTGDDGEDETEDTGGLG